MKDNQPLTLRRNFSWTFFGNIVYAACQWGILIILAKLGNPEMVGQFTLGLAVTAPIIMFSNLQLRLIQATDAKRQYLFGDYFGLRLLATSLAMVAIAAIVFTKGYRWETAIVIILVGLAKAVESISDVFFGLLQQRERMDRIAQSLILKGVISLAMLALGVYLTRNVIWGVSGLVIGWILVLFFYDLKSGIKILRGSLGNSQNDDISADTNEQKNPLILLRPRWNLPTLKKLTFLSLPMGIVMMLISLNTNIPRYFIENYLGERELGIFAAISYLMYAGQIIESALGQAATPRLAKYYSEGKKNEFIKLLLKLIGMGITVGSISTIFSFFLGKQILQLLYTSEYIEQSEVFILTMVTMTIEYVASFLCYGLISARKLNIQVPLFITVATTAAIASLWLIPIYGLKGAAIALLISTFVRAIISAILMLYALHKIPKENPEVNI